MAKILIIDDMEPIRKSINIILSADGHDIDEAENGLLGLEKIKSEGYDLIITDILMPEKDGTELLMQLKSDGNKSPVLAISGGGSFVPGDYALSLAENYADAILRKPFGKNDLKQAVEKLLAAAVA